MNEIQGQAQTIRELLSNKKYCVDYYQREYKWQEKQINELIEDVTSRFLEDYDPAHPREAVADYRHYFLGSIIISRKGSQNFLVDGQQRLTTLTLLLMYLHNITRTHRDGEEIESVVSLILSHHYGKKTFNLDVEERNGCMEALFEDRQFDTTDRPESVRNIVQRYEDIKNTLSEELLGAALPYFIDWLINNVHLVEITAHSDEDAYTIFETMNDRGLSLSPTDMLKGYLLANIWNEKRETANRLWKQRLAKLQDYGKEVDADFFKFWLRSQYAQHIRERKKGAKAEDFDRIGTEFHRWLRDNHERLGLTNAQAFAHFVERDFDFYVRQYEKLLRASQTFTLGLEHVYYNARLGFTTQYQLLLAPLTPSDSEETIQRKFRLVAIYLDILLNRRIWNWHNIGFSTMQYAMFLVMREIRGLPPEELVEKLYARLENETFTDNPRFALTQRNGIFVHLMLARLTDYIERASGMPSHYVAYVSGTGTNKYEVEHIWANKPEQHRDEFAQPADFLEYRNRIGGLLLLPKSFNASFGALPYVEKVEHYDAQNLLARSLNPRAYEHNPGFHKFVTQTELPFRAYSQFHKQEFEQRQQLYCQLAEQVWNPAQLREEVAQ